MSTAVIVAPEQVKTLFPFTPEEMVAGFRAHNLRPCSSVYLRSGCACALAGALLLHRAAQGGTVEENEQFSGDLIADELGIPRVYAHGIEYGFGPPLGVPWNAISSWRLPQDRALMAAGIRDGQAIRAAFLDAGLAFVSRPVA